MKRTVAFILTAVLVLGMIPATVITAFAHGYGVAGNNWENQSQPNALGQSVPETIAVDGELNDTGWREDLWNLVDNGSGVWNTDFPESQNQGLKYEYQLRTDYNYFYTTAVISLPKGQKIGRFCVYLSDENPNKTEDPVRGVTGGFTFNIDLNATENKVNVTAEAGIDEKYYADPFSYIPDDAVLQSNGHYLVEAEYKDIYFADPTVNNSNNGRSILSIAGQKGYANNIETAPSGTITEYAAYKFEYDVKGDDASGYTITLEFRNRALDTYDTDKKLYHYVSVGVPRENQVNNNYKYDTLFFPAFTRSNQEKFTSIPGFENWPDTGMQVNYTDNLSGDGDEEVMPGAIKVDGVFDEAVWSGMTDYYTKSGAYGNTLYKDTVSNDPFGTLVDLSTVGYNEKSDGNNWANLQFKYDVRTDANYLYGAIYVYAKMDSNYDRTSVIFRIFNENNAQTHAINMSLKKDGTKNLNCQIDRAAPYQNGGKWEWSSVTLPAEHFEYGISVNGDYYTYEFRIPLEIIDNDEIAYKWTDTEGSEKNSTRVTDNTSKDGMYYSITVGRKGSSTNNQWSSCGIGANNSSYTYDKNVSIRKKIDKSKYVGNASESVVIDGKLDDPHWTAIRGGDNAFDYSKRPNTTARTLASGTAATPPPAKVSEFERLIYNVTADNDYIYGAVYVKMAEGKAWSTSSSGARSLLRFVVAPYGTPNGTPPRRIVNMSLKDETLEIVSYVNLNGGFFSETSTENGGDGDYVNGDVVFKFDSTKNQVMIEFRLNISDFEIKPDLNASDTNTLFGYFLSLEDSRLGSNSPKGSSLIHPALGGFDSNFDYSLSDYTAYNKYTKKLAYGDMLDTVVIDGNLEEQLWDNMTHVGEGNGTYQYYPVLGKQYEYDYSVYVGNKFLYGAAVFDGIYTEDTSRFTIWFDNGIDERTLITDDHKIPNKCEFEFFKETVVVNTDTGLSYDITQIRYFPNHNYSFALNGNQYDGPYDNEYWDSNPEANPDHYLLYDVSDNVVVKKNGTDYKYKTTQINGKTYLEFIIDLDTVHVDPEDFRYYVCFDHFVSDPGNEDDDIHLYYPKVEEYKDMFWLTHKDITYTQGYDAAGVVFTNYANYNKIDATSFTYWRQYALNENNDGTYTVMEVLDTQQNVKDSEKKKLSSGYDLYYTINVGTIYEDGRNARNIRALQAYKFTATWGVGDILAIDLKGDTFNSFNETNAKPRDIIIYNTLNESITDPPKNSHTGEYYNINRVEKNNQKFDGYYVPYTVTVTRSADSIDTSLDSRNAMMPNMSNKYGRSDCWMYYTSKIVEPLSYITPEGVIVDGKLGDSGWKENGWINVSGDINATDYRASEGVDYKYQLRADHDYLYVAAVLDTAFDEGVSFKLWLKGAGESGYDNMYEFAYGETTVDIVKGKVSHELQTSTLKEEAAKGAEYSAEALVFPYVIKAYNNKGANELGYGESAVFGYTKELVESDSDGIWVWEAYPRTYGFRYGNEHGVIASGAGVTVNNTVATADQTVVEFKIGFDEFGGKHDFEYFVEATDSNGTTYYPQIFSELESELNYYDYNYPTVKWDSDRAAEVSVADVTPSGAIWLVDKYTPVVTLGAKVSEHYIDSEGKDRGKAIRLGALYTEEYIRKLPVSETDSVTDYWDVADVGIIALPTAYVAAGAKLDHSNSEAVCTSAINIVDWIYDSETGEGTNFADYESFVFYATFYGVPEGIELSFAAYIDYYNANGTETYYDTEFVRSYSMVEQLVNENSNLPE